MRKWVSFLQLEPGQEAYCLFGDKDKEIVVKCECKSVYIFHWPVKIVILTLVME